MRKLYIIGAGGFGREVAWLIKRINRVKPIWEIVGYIDDNSAYKGKIENGYSVLGGCEYLENCSNEIYVVCAVGNAKVRSKIIQRIEKKENIKFATLIDPSVILSQYISIGEGSIICAGTIVTVNVEIGRHVIINLDCTIGHDVQIKDFVTVYPSVNISGNVTIDALAEIGTGTQIIQGRNIGRETIVGAGATVVKNLPEGCTAVGCPASPIKYNNNY